MSRLFPERVTVVLAPSEIAIGDKTLACDPAFGPDPWQGAVNALRAHEFKQRCHVTVILSNHFVRYALVPWNDALSGAAEEEAYVRHHFRKIHGERAKDWSVRASEAPRGAPRLASAIDTKLLEELKRSFPKGKAKLVSVQPRLMAEFNRHLAQIPASGAWLTLAEPGRACVALYAQGAWRSVQSARGELAALLERERLRVAGEAPDQVLALSS